MASTPIRLWIMLSPGIKVVSSLALFSCTAKLWKLVQGLHIILSIGMTGTSVQSNPAVACGCGVLEHAAIPANAASHASFSCCHSILLDADEISSKQV